MQGVKFCCMLGRYESLKKLLVEKLRFEHHSIQPKKGLWHSKNAYNYNRCWRIINDDDQKEKLGTPRMLIITIVAQRLVAKIKRSRKRRIRERTKMCSFLFESQQFWHIIESVNVPKFEYIFPLRNKKIVKITWTNKKRGTPEMFIITCVFEDKSRWWSKTNKADCKNVNNYNLFWTMLMITLVEERWRGFSCWVWQGLQQQFEAHAMRDENDAARNFEFRGG